MELKALFCSVSMTGLVAVWLLLWVVSEQRGDHRKTSAHDETGVGLCLPAIRRFPT